MLKVGQIEEAEITGYSSEGAGVCRIDGCAVFVPNAIRGEVCEIRVTHISRNSAHGKIERILRRSPRRTPRACPDAKLCGGCQLHHMDYEEELAFKAQKVADALTRLGGVEFDNCLRVPITGAAEISGYRNKAQYPLAMKNGKPIAGFYKNRTHEVIPIRRCAILPEIFDRVKDVVLRWAEEDRVSVYDEATGRGLLRHIYVRQGAVSGQIMVCLVVNGEGLPRENRLIHALCREIPGLASLVLSVNRRNTNVVLGSELRTLWGKPYVEDQLCGFTFRLSPHSFYQVNHDQAQRLYAKALELADLHGTETVLDLYCGTGTITLALSRAAGTVVGVEVVPQAIEDAKENARRNGVTNVRFLCADVAEVFSEGSGTSESSGALCAPRETPEFRDEGMQNAECRMQNEGSETGNYPLSIFNLQLPRPDVIVVDPPRKGLAPAVIDAMAKLSPDRIVYVSCDPATLARDVKLLTQRGYTLTHAEAFDLFPRTFHVETVVLLTRNT